MIHSLWLVLALAAFGSDRIPADTTRVAPKPPAARPAPAPPRGPAAKAPSKPAAKPVGEPVLKRRTPPR